MSASAAERAVGGWLHRRIVARPSAEAALLNQYRSGEDFHHRYPAVVCPDLLPAALRRRFVRHQEDETRHEALYARRIVALGGQPAAVSEARDYLPGLWRELSARGLGLPYRRFLEERPLDREELMRMFAFQVVVEERGLLELALHLPACLEADAETARAIEEITRDERYHVAYSQRALLEAAGPAGAKEAEGRIAKVRACELRVYARVTAAMLEELSARELGDLGPLDRGALRLLAAGMRSQGGAAPAATRDGWGR